MEDAEVQWKPTKATSTEEESLLKLLVEIENDDFVKLWSEFYERRVFKNVEASLYNARRILNSDWMKEHDRIVAEKRAQEIFTASDKLIEKLRGELW